MMVCVNPQNMPVLSNLDAERMYSMPKGRTIFLIETTPSSRYGFKHHPRSGVARLRSDFVSHRRLQMAPMK